MSIDKEEVLMANHTAATLILKKAPYYYLILLTVMGTIRSLIHMFASDSGAMSIAGIPIEGEAGVNLVAIIGQWGASQLVVAMMGLAVVLRYRQLVSFMLGIQLMELALRLGVGFLKPLMVAATPPGVYGTWILLPITALFWVWSLRSPHPG